MILPFTFQKKSDTLKTSRQKPLTGTAPDEAEKGENKMIFENLNIDSFLQKEKIALPEVPTDKEVDAMAAQLMLSERTAYRIFAAAAVARQNMRRMG